MNSSTVLEIFKEITRIPRESGHEAPMTEYLVQWAKNHNLSFKKDETGNVLITKEASKGKENIPCIVLQSHQDMVCEKEDGSKHDFLNDPIDYVIEDGWMISKETTLGADDGIGIAASLAILQSNLPTGKIECLFTISEETGMDGATALQSGFMSGKTLLNLDSEDEGEMFVGCAGGVNSNIEVHYTSAHLNNGWQPVRVKIGGGIGGHSGDDINKGRMNAVHELALFLGGELSFGLQLASFVGGGKHNAIARSCEAIVAVPDAMDCKSRFETFAKKVKSQFADSDPAIEFAFEKIDNADVIIADADSHKLIKALCSCPNGVIAMSKEIEGLVQTSTNLAAVKMKENGIINITTSQRSDDMKELKEIADRVCENFSQYGFDAVQVNPYPGWKPNMNSHILKVCVESYEKLFGYAPKVKAIHAGLECGLFLEKFPDLDMISFGPTLRGVHAPGEKLELASLDKFTDHLVDVVCNFK